MTISTSSPDRRKPATVHFKTVGPTAFDERGLDRHLDEHRMQQAGGRIRCPLCDWQPGATDRWFCISMGPPENYASGCGHGWHTFDTRGQCPGCMHHWRFTTCLSCNQWSPHDDWYV